MSCSVVHHKVVASILVGFVCCAESAKSCRHYAIALMQCRGRGGSIADVLMLLVCVLWT